MSAVAEPSEPTTPRARRRQQTLDEILQAAWRLARRDGLAAVSMRELGAQVGLRAQSLYAYFSSKDDLYDLMFRQGHEEMRRWVELAPLPTGLPIADAVAELRGRLHAFVAFCNADATRYQLLFQRVIPDWEPSATSYALAIEQLESTLTLLHQIGVSSPEAGDMFTAIVTGLTSQQLTNDPGGDRWGRLVDDATTMFLGFYPPTEDGGTTKQPPGEPGS